MKTWINYTRSYFINSSIDKYDAASPLFLGKAHVIFAVNKIATFRSPNLRRNGLLGFPSTPYPWLVAPLPFPHQVPPVAIIRTWILLRFKVSHCCNYELDFWGQSPRRRPTIQNPTFIIKLSSFIRNILIALLVLTCSRFQVGIKTLACQADHASARSVTPGDFPNDCIGARALHV
jgi:hypothetical protein